MPRRLSNEWTTTQSAWFWLCMILSIVLPFAVTAPSIRAALGAKPAGARSASTKRLAEGEMHAGSLCYPAYLGLGIESSFRMCVFRLDLNTGEEKETELRIDGLTEIGDLCRVGEDLYFVTWPNCVHERSFIETRLWRVVDNRFQEIEIPASHSKLVGQPFEFERSLTFVEKTPEGRFQLIHWNSEHWKTGREIALPDEDICWIDDKDLHREVMLPRTSLRPPPYDQPFSRYLELRIFPDPADFSLVVFDEYLRSYGYRRGFEFIDRSAAIASGLSPENAPAESSAWYAASVSNLSVAQVVKRRGPPSEILSLSRFDGKENVWCRQPDGSVSPLIQEPDRDGIGEERIALMIAANQLEPEAFLIRENTWGSRAISRIDKTTLHAAHVITPGLVPDYLAYWLRLSQLAVAVWLLHNALVVIACSRIPRPTCAAHEYTAILSPIPRRCFAFLVDLAMAVVVLIACLTIVPYGAFAFPTSIQVAESIEWFEHNAVVGQPWSTIPGRVLIIVANFAKENWEERKTKTLVVLAACQWLYLVKIFFEARCGLTPGKWLLGIRTVGINLRSIGVFQVLIRDLASCLDFLLFLTAFPAAISWFRSAKYQRLGDRWAATVVIRSGSLHEIDQALPNSASDL